MPSSWSSPIVAFQQPSIAQSVGLGAPAATICHRKPGRFLESQWILVNDEAWKCWFLRISAKKSSSAARELINLSVRGKAKQTKESSSCPDPVWKSGLPWEGSKNQVVDTKLESRGHNLPQPPMCSTQPSSVSSCWVAIAGDIVPWWSVCLACVKV